MLAGVGKHGGVSGVDDKDQREYDAQRHADSDRHAVVISVEDGLQDADEQHTAKSETDSACQADVPVYIVGMPAVIPPADTPFPQEPNTGEVFQCSAENAGEHKNSRWVPAQSAQQQDQQNTACAVDRQIRSSVHAAVHKGVGCHKIEQDLPKPTGESRCKKQQCIVVKWIDGFWVCFFHRMQVGSPLILIFFFNSISW